MTIIKTRSLAFILIACLLAVYFLLDPLVSADTVTISSENYVDGGDISSTGLNLNVNAPLIATRYTAGNGYVDWDPDIATLTLNNAEINVVSDVAEAIIILPEHDINISLEGNNSIIRTYPDDYDYDNDDYTEIIQQGEFLQFSQAATALEDVKDYLLTIEGTGSLNLSSESGQSLFSTDGTFIMENGFLSSDDNAENLLVVARYLQKGGSIFLESGFSVLENAEISNGSLIGAGKGYSAFACYGDLTISGGFIKFAPSALSAIVVPTGEFIHTGGELSALIANIDVQKMAFNYRVYGDLTLLQAKYDGSLDAKNKTNLNFADHLVQGASAILNIPADNSLTIPAGSFLKMKLQEDQNLSDCLINNGRLINNGKIIIELSDENPDDNRIENLAKETAELIDPQSTGQIIINGEIFSNLGNRLTILSNLPALTPGDYFNDPGISFYFEDGNYILDLDNVIIEGDLSIPSNIPFVIRSSSTAVIENIVFSNYYACNLTFTGGGVIYINNRISSGYNGDIMNVNDGTQVHVAGWINIGGSGGQEGTLNVNGSGTSLTVDPTFGTAIYLASVNVSDGAELNALADDDSTGIFANGDGVSVTNNSKLSAHCKYGIYIIDGSLIVDETSELITNGVLAPFCIVDKTNEKTEEELISLPFIPAGHTIAFITGNEPGFGYTYWSLIPLAGTLAVTDENSEPVNLWGASTDLLSFAYTPTNDDDPDQGGNNDGDTDNNNPGTDTGSNTGGNPGTDNNSPSTNPAQGTDNSSLPADNTNNSDSLNSNDSANPESSAAAKEEANNMGSIPKTGENNTASAFGIILLLTACCLTAGRQVRKKSFLTN